VAEPLHVPVGSPLRRSAFAQRAAVEFCDRRIASGTTAAMVFGSAFPDAQDALFAETNRRGLRMVSGRGIQTVGPKAAEPLMTSKTTPSGWPATKSTSGTRPTPVM